ncbi:MAG TPA: DNA polymerase [Candidatus Acidoferrum sp.]
MYFGGATFDPEHDESRLRAQLTRVYKLMSDGKWRTLEQISQATGDPEASISARLRDFRKEKFGGYDVKSERISGANGLWRYRINNMQTKQFLLGNTDLSQIECRVLNTLAGQWDVVEKFRNHVDIYSELATSFYGFPVDKSKPAERGTGKQLELSCGYGAGGPTIVRTARAGTYGPPVRLTDQQGLDARNLYRGTHPFVGALWERASQILWTLKDGHTMEWGPPGQPAPCMWIHDHRIFHHASGLWLDYSSLDRVRLDTGEEIWRHNVRGGWRKTYGARLVENVVQWLARIVISDAMKRVSTMGYKIPLTVHDNIYTLIPVNAANPQDCLKAICEEVARPVPWLEACPIAAEAELLDALAMDKPLFKYVVG